MTANRFVDLVLSSPQRLAMPIAVYPGAALAGVKVSDVVTNPRAQCEASASVRRRFGTPFALTAMDLSVEAEAFGAEIVMSDHEIPTVVGRRVTTLEQAQALGIPEPGAGRTGVYLEAARLLKKLGEAELVVGGCIGPFSLAGRLAGVGEALELTLVEPGLMHTLVEKSTRFLLAYVRAFRDAGADAVLMAEPGAGLLSPRWMSEFSSAYIRRIVSAVSDGRFALVLHNCAARAVHLAALLESGAPVFHFGAPMDLAIAVERVDSATVVCGNLDPVGVFAQCSPEVVRSKTLALLEATRDRRNHVVSSGCDVPASVPMGQLDAFFEVVREWQAR